MFCSTMTARSREETIRQLAESLRSDTTDFRLARNFCEALGEQEAAGKVNLHYGLTLPHVRTAAVTKMLMAFGRLTAPLPGKGWSASVRGAGWYSSEPWMPNTFGLSGL